MPSMTPTSTVPTMPLLVATRFGLGIRDPAWYEHRLALLAAITAPSLLAQEDENFLWTIFADTNIPAFALKELEALVAPFEGRASVRLGGHSPRSLVALARERCLVTSGSDGYLLTGRIDDDDAWDRRTVRMVRERVGRWDEEGKGLGLALTFENGLVWLMYDMIDVDHREREGTTVIRHAALRPYRYPFTSISGFVYSSLGNGLTAISGSHARIPDIARDKGFDIEVISTGGEPMWLYCRHKQATSPIHRAGRQEPLHLSLGEMSSKFGIDEQGTSAYIEESGRFGYSRVLRLLDLRGRLWIKLRRVRGEAVDPTISRQRRGELRAEASAIETELMELSENVVASGA
jgi:hypothetical protein